MDRESPVQTAPTNSPNEAIHAEHSNVQQVKIVLPVSVWAVAVACAIAIMASGLALYEANQNHKEAWLNSYDIQQLKIGPVSYLEAEQKTTQDLVQAYGIGKTCKGAHHGR